MPKIQAESLSPKEVLINFADAMANKYKVNKKPFITTLDCESGFKNIQSRVLKKGGPNEREDSWGIAQINLPSHPSITRAQALDPYWSIEWAAQKFKINPRIWTCARRLGYATVNE